MDHVSIRSNTDSSGSHLLRERRERRDRLSGQKAQRDHLAVHAIFHCGFGTLVLVSLRIRLGQDSCQIVLLESQFRVPGQCVFSWQCRF